MDRRHGRALDAKLAVEDGGDRGEAVGRARGVRDDVHRRRAPVLGVVDAKDEAAKGDEQKVS